MRYGIELIPFGEFGDPRAAVRLAQAAEAAGWEALWVWDHVNLPWGVGDPWVILSAVAQATRNLRLLVGVAPIPRYPPHLLARLTASLDRLSDGRLVLGAGIGGMAEEFELYGDDPDPTVRAEKTDEGLELLARYWSGEPVQFTGRHYTARGASQPMTPVQQPRLPVWIGGDSPAALRRAARWDGWVIGVIDEHGNATKSPARLAEQVADIRRQRESDAPFEVAIDGVTKPENALELIQPYARAGATWYFEAVYGLRGSLDEMLRRIEAGVPA